MIDLQANTRRLAWRFMIPLIIALAGTALPSQASERLTERNEALVRDAFARWSAGEDVFAALLADDIVWHIRGSGPVAGTYRGLDDFVERAARPLTSRLRGPVQPRLLHLWAQGEHVIVRFDGSATTLAGEPYRNQFVWIFRLQDEQVVEAEAFLDLNAYQTVVDNTPLP